MLGSPWDPNNEDVYQLYAEDVSYAAAVVERLRWADPPHVPKQVLDAHWDTEEAFELLQTLSIAHRIVPTPLAPFIEDCRQRGRDYMVFLHPDSLFLEPELAVSVYAEVAAAGYELENLQVLRYLADDDRALQYRHLLQGFLTRGFAGCLVAERPWHASYICELCHIYVDNIAALDVNVLSGLLRNTSCARDAALALAFRMDTATQAHLASALATCAELNFGCACRILHDLSHGPHFAAVADAVVCHKYMPYIERMSIRVLRCIVPYLRENCGIRALRRIVASDGPACIRTGVFTSLIHLDVSVPDVPPVENPQGVHEAIHYMHCHSDVTPDRRMVDKCMAAEMPALYRIARRSQRVRRQIVCSRNWTRRRQLLMCLRTGAARKGTWLHSLQMNECIWPVVMTFI